MPLIIFGIIAVITVLFLIIYNMKSVKSHRRTMVDKPKEKLLNEQMVDRKKELRGEPQQKTIVESSSQVVSLDKDHDYRQALRDFAGEETPSGNPTMDENPLSPDEEYRQALRSMKQDH